MAAPVVLLSMDTVRQDVFNSQCFPESWPVIESDFTRFSNSLSGGVATPHAFPSIITGQPVVGDGEFVLGATTVAERCAGEAIAFSNNGHVRAGRGYDQGLDHFGDIDPPTHQGEASRTIFKRLKQVDLLRNSTILRKSYNWYSSIKPDPPYSKPNLPADTVTEWALAELRGSPPAFLWTHYMDAHKPFIPEFSVDGPEVNISKEKLAYMNDYDREDDPPSDDHIKLLWELYESNVRHLDQGLGRLLRELQNFEWYSDALIIIVSDHGELFGEHGHMWHPMTIDPVDELINTPLAVKYPNGKRSGDVVERRVQHADVPATVEAFAGSKDDVPENIFPLLDTEPRATVSKSNTSIRVTGPDGYVIRRRDGSQDEHGTVSSSLREMIQSEEFPNVRTSGGVVRGIEDVQRIEQLEALGYR